MLTKMQIRQGQRAERGRGRGICVGCLGYECVFVCAISFGNRFKEISLSALIRTPTG